MTTTQKRKKLFRTVRVKVYQFEGLTDKAKEKARDWFRDGDFSIYESSREISNSVKALGELFNLKFGREYTDIRTSHIDDNILNLTGVRLYKYIINNYYSILFTRKTYWFCRNEDGTKRFNCIGENGGKYISKCQWEVNQCPLTGVCYDMDILQPVYDFIEKIDPSETFEGLISSIESAIGKCYRNNEEWVNSDEYIDDAILANDYEFTVDGKRFIG